MTPIPRGVRPGYWLSFVDRIGDVAVNLGVAIVAGTTMQNAVRLAWQLQINPGGEVRGEHIPDLRVLPEALTFRLLTDPGDIAEAQIVLARSLDPPADPDELLEAPF